MVQRYLTITLFSFLLQLSVLAQCVPDTNMVGLYAPPINEGLPDAFIGQGYEAAIFIHAPADTLVNNLFTLNVDSLVLQDVSGLPDGITFNCNTADCKFIGGSYGCINLVGFPTDTQQVGNHPLVASFLFYLSGAINTSLAYDITDYDLNLNGYTGIKKSDNHLLEFEVTPNPANANATLFYELPKSGSYTLRVYSLLGAELANIREKGSAGRSSLKLQTYIRQPGVYFATINQDGYTRTMRFIVQ